jgi:predicted DNA binding CopG/RHH family protein
MEKVLPQMDSIKEMAQFWDTHDLTDFEDELEEVQETVFERSTVWIRFRPDEVEVIKSLARARGISDSNLIREWVLERIQETDARP